MPQIAANDLLARIEKGKTIPAILLLGEEPYLRDLCRTQLIEKYVQEAARAWAVSRFSADKGEVKAATDQAQTLPMLSPQQVVFLEDVQAIEKYGEKKRDEAVADLEAYLANPATFTVLVLEADSLDQRMKLSKLLAEKSLVVEVGLGENPDQRIAAAVAMAKTIARDESVTLEKGAAEELAECVAADLQRLKTELSKLATYVGDRKNITVHDVTSLVISEKASTVWELADMLASRQSKRALEFLDRILREGEEPLPILGAITWMYRKLVEASEVRGAANGWQAARALGMRPEQAELALRNSKKISKARLLAGLGVLQKADDRLKRGGEDARAVLEFVITELSAEEAVAARR